MRVTRGVWPGAVIEERQRVDECGGPHRLSAERTMTVRDGVEARPAL